MTKQKQYTPLTNFQWDDILANFDPKSFQQSRRSMTFYNAKVQLGKQMDEIK